MSSISSNKERKMRACIVPSCNGQRYELVHKFPMDSERATEWLRLINAPNTKHLTLSQLRQRLFVCSKHFPPNDYKNIESRSLNKTAMPSLNLDRRDVGPSDMIEAADHLVVDDVIQYHHHNDDELKDEPPLQPAKRKYDDLMIDESRSAAEVNQVSSSTSTPLKQYAPSSSATYRLINADIFKSHQSKQLQSTLMPSSENVLCDMAAENDDADSDAQKTSEQLISFVNEDDFIQAHILLKPTALDNNDGDEPTTERFLIDDNNIDDLIINKVPSADQSKESENKDCNGDFLTIVSPDDGAMLRLSTYWLRDHCRCCNCFNPQTQTRNVNLFAMPMHVANFIVRRSRLEIDCKFIYCLRLFYFCKIIYSQGPTVINRLMI